MDKKIISFAEENKVEELTECLKAVSNYELCKMIERKVLKGRNDTFTLVRAILLGSPPDSTVCVERRSHVYKQCIDALQKNDMNNKMASELVGLLMLEADTLPGPTLAELASIYVDGIKSDSTQSGKALELLPKILSAIASQENIVYAGNHMKGSEYKGHVLNSLCSCKWDPGSVVNLASMFRDVPLTNEELKFVIEKVLRMFRELDMGDIPALVYQLLLLATKGHKKLVLEGIINFFTEQDSHQKPVDNQEFSEDLLDDSINNTESLRHTEGTVILHISFAVKQHQDLGREFLKCLKGYQNCSATKTLSPFSLAMALSLARINRFEDQIFDFLKTTFLKSYKDHEKQSQSCWIQEVVSDMVSVEEYVIQTVQNSTYGWDHVVQGLVQLGFILMDSFGPKAVFGRIDILPSIQTGPTHQTCQLGAKILLKTFKAHEMVRSEILEQIFNRVITKATSPVSHFLELLGDIVFASPQLLLDSTTKVREMFDYLSFLCPTSAEGLLRAIQPLLKLSMNLKDSLILVLRKAMFSRQLDARKIGASGFLMILKHFRVLGGIRSSQSSQPSFSSSQISVDVHIPHNASSNEALCLEILGNLRRCLSQQADVRLLLYQGLVDVLDRNTQLRDPILSMLMSQLKCYYEKNEEMNPPLKLEPCILAQGDQVYLAEPLAHLLGCIQLCLIKSDEIKKKQQSGASDDDDDDDDDESAVQSELEQMMKSLINRMITSEMEDFELDKSADYSLANSVGVRNNIFAILILGTYEALIEYTFMTGTLNESKVRQMLQLFENQKKLSGVLREKAGAAAGKKGKTQAKSPISLLSLKFVTQVMDFVISENEDYDRDLVDTLGENTDFFKYVLTVTQQKLHQIQDKGQCDGSEGKQKTKIFNYCCELAGLLLKYYKKNQTGEGSQRVTEKQILTLTLECLCSVVTIVTQQYISDLDKFLSSLAETKDNENIDEQIYQDIKKLQGKILIVLSSDDLSLCKSMLTYLLTMGQKWKTSPILLRELSQDIHTQIGDIDQEIELDGRTNFAVVTQRAAAPTVLQIVVNQGERELDNTDWVVTRVRADATAELASSTGGESPQLTQREGHEKSICTRLGVIVTAFHELVQSALPIGPCTEQLLKVLTRIYGTLTMLVKYYLSLYASRSGHLSARFEKLVKLSGTHLTHYCYGLITYIQTSESENITHAAPDKGKKKKDDKKKTNTAQSGKANVMKQTRTIPNLIFAIEQYERYLIQLSKKSKINLMEHMKHSTSRDFRINTAVLAESLDNQSSSDVDDSDGENDESTVGDNTTVRNEQTIEENSGESDQENEPAAANVPDPVDEPVKKKTKLAAKRTVGKKSKS
ncbi:Fanconi anemia group I protein-like [Mercenaria mercenaria]|uniref:Fanconi anemia group I protein-like n=1 Tax=Mercenaria mercenaria TaxID=6596 RepID=UPI00234F22CE|nr:Fanconi anemia group I protein-like [Mercenaria mercenaria]